MSFSFALSESRRLFLRSPSVRSLASAVSEPRQFFVACEDCTARFALSLLWRLDNRVSSSSALSEARRIFLVSSALTRMYARVVVELELRYVQRPLYTYIYIYRKIAARWLARSRSPIRVGPSLHVHVSTTCFIFHAAYTMCIYLVLASHEVFIAVYISCPLRSWIAPARQQCHAFS